MPPRKETQANSHFLQKSSYLSVDNIKMQINVTPKNLEPNKIHVIILYNLNN